MLEQDVPAIPEDTASAAAPPPRPRLIEWNTAMRCAAAVAGVAAVLSVTAIVVPAVTPLNWLWIVTGSLTVLAFYQRRKPQARMSAGIGARIGIVTGLAQVSFVAFAMTVAGLVARFSMHRMGGFDAMLAVQMHTQIQHAAETRQVPQDLLATLYSPEFTAGMMLTGIVMVGSSVLLLSTLGGALGGLLRTRPGRTA